MVMIGTKLCHHCGEQQALSSFPKRSSSKDGHSSTCKKCYSEYNKKYYEANKERYKKTRAEYYKNHIEKCKAQHKRYREAHPWVSTEHTRSVHREWYANRTEEQKERMKIQNREYQRANKDKVSKWHKKYRETHKEQLREASKRYRVTNRIKINSSHIERLHTDSGYRMKEQIRNMIRYAFRSKGHHKNSRTKEIVGCDLDFLCEYLFKTWERNYGKPWNGEPYHIDHIIPLATAETEEEVRRLCHYTNLQLLTPEDNMAKGDKITRL